MGLYFRNPAHLNSSCVAFSILATHRVQRRHRYKHLNEIFVATFDRRAQAAGDCRGIISVALRSFDNCADAIAAHLDAGFLRLRGGFAEPAVLEGFEHARQSRVKPRGMRRLFVPSGESRDGRGREEEQPGEGSDHGGTGRADYSRYSG